MHHILIIIGNLGRDPEMKYTNSGQAVTSFSVASSRTYTSQSGERVKETTWFRCSAWGKLAEVCNEYLKKGSKVYIEGRLQPDKATGNPRLWTKSDGESSTSYEVNVNTIQFLSARSTESHTAEQDAGDIGF